MAQKSAAKKAKLTISSAKPRPSTPSNDSESDASLSEDNNDDLEVPSGDEFEDLSDESDNDVDDESDSERDDEKKNDKFGTAMDAILGSKIKAHDSPNPILIRNKRPIKEIEEAREEAKARRALRAEKLQHRDKARVRNVIPTDPEEAGDVLSKEKKLKKIAQKGVVRLLNAIHSAQAAAIQGAEGTHDKKVAETSTELSKEKFLDMIRMG